MTKEVEDLVAGIKGNVAARRLKALEHEVAVRAQAKQAVQQLQEALAVANIDGVCRVTKRFMFIPYQTFVSGKCECVQTGKMSYVVWISKQVYINLAFDGFAGCGIRVVRHGKTCGGVYVDLPHNVCRHVMTKVINEIAEQQQSAV